jgi:sterol desaturase/sphingolipid hydroxylase (fatty acid hydroxylase superfamily)
MLMQGLEQVPQQVLEIARTVKAHVPIEIKEYYWAALEVWSSPALWALFALILVLERVIPADPKQPLFSRGVAQDFIWFNFDIVLGVAFVPAVAGTIKLVYDRITGGYVLSFAESWHPAVIILVALLVTDLLFYFKHWLHHVNKNFLWHFHAIHHSQREMNALTDRRQHFLEHVFTQTIVFLPLIAMGLKPYVITAVGAALWWQTLLIHGNIRTNFGPLRWIIVSPQFHRVHHSIEVQHWDKNYGAWFTVWDWMFGTIYPKFDEYPATGVKDVYFPPPKSFKPHAWAADFGRQMWHPFSRMMHRKQSDVSLKP